MNIGGCDMLLNNIELDIKTKCIEEKKTQTKVAEEIGTSKSYFSRIVNGQDKIVNSMFVKALDVLGYDVQLTYVKKKSK
jgi:hypothetical protein